MSLDAMKQALAALENSRSYVEFDWIKNQCGRAITALSAAIDQAQEPIGHADLGMSNIYIFSALEPRKIPVGRTPLYTAPRQWQAQEPVAWVYPQALEAFKKGHPWVAYGSNGDGPHCDGVQRIPLYLHNDAVARRVEPRASGSGAGFESLPASPTTEQNV